MPIPIFRRILTPWIFLSSRYERLGMGFCRVSEVFLYQPLFLSSQLGVFRNKEIDVRTIGFEPASRLDFQIRILRSTITAICERLYIGTYNVDLSATYQ